MLYLHSANPVSTFILSSSKEINYFGDVNVVTDYCLHLYVRMNGLVFGLDCTYFATDAIIHGSALFRS